MFNIRDHVEFDHTGRATCPACARDGKTKSRNLSVAENGAYKCFRGCTPDEIRDALGAPRPQQIPSAFPPVHHPIATNKPSATPTVSPQKIKAAHQQLMDSDGVAKQWLHQRGITDEMIARYSLGIARAKVGDRHLPAITIPIPNHDGTAYYQKKRIAPWLTDADKPSEYYPWSQKGIPAKTWFTWLPAEATETYVCEGEWDAMMLGWTLRKAEKAIAVACFTCGCGTIPPQDQLDLLPGRVTIFYDRNDKPNKQGIIPGEHGAKKLAEALGQRGYIGSVPMPENCTVKGWDVTDALLNGATVADFLTAAKAATQPPPPTRDNPLRDKLIWNDELIRSAPDYTEWLVPDLFTANELFLLASGPRMGKSLLSMSLARAVASGESFLGRPVMQGTVLYVCLEDSPAKIKEREQAQQWAEGLPVVWLNRFKLKEIDYLKEIIQELDPRLVIIDTLSRAKDGSISESSSEMSQVLEPLQEIAGELETCILLVHHTGKISTETMGQVDIFDTIRGSSAIRAVCRGTVIIAAGETREFRLLAENGWGKHDLRVSLDGITLTWKLLGKWNPSVNSGQTESVLNYLKKVQSATLDEMSEVLQIPKKSLYKVLERLQGSDITEEKVVKHGKRRNYRYTLALYHSVKTLEPLFDTIRQNATLSNRRNADGDSDRSLYETKSSFFLEPEVIIDHFDERSTRNTNSVELSDQLSETESQQAVESVLCPPCTKSLKPASEDDSNKMITSARETPERTFVEYAPSQGSSPDGETDSPIRQLFDKDTFVEYTGREKTDHPDTVLQSNSTASDHKTIAEENNSSPYRQGDLVTILATATWVRKGSTPIHWKDIPKPLRSAAEIPINMLEGAIFNELTAKFTVDWAGQGNVRVINPETKRVSIFRADGVRLIQRRGGES